VKPPIGTQGVKVPSHQSRSGQVSSEHCRLPGDWQAPKRMQRGSRPRGLSSEIVHSCECRQGTKLGRQDPVVRQCEDGRSRRSLRPGHAFIGVSREPRRAGYSFDKLRDGCAHKECNPVYGGGGRTHRSEHTLDEGNHRQGKPEATVMTSPAVLRSHSTDEGGEPQGSREGRPGYPLEGRGEQMDGAIR